jgi:hypothetical protein
LSLRSDDLDSFGELHTTIAPAARSRPVPRGRPAPSPAMSRSSPALDVAQANPAAPSTTNVRGTAAAAALPAHMTLRIRVRFSVALSLAIAFAYGAPLQREAVHTSTGNLRSVAERNRERSLATNSAVSALARCEVGTPPICAPNAVSDWSDRKKCRPRRPAAANAPRPARAGPCPAPFQIEACGSKPARTRQRGQAPAAAS